MVAIPETLVGRAKDGAATVTLWSDADKKYAAKLREIAPVGRSGDANLSRKILAAGRRRQAFRSA